jgi:hypothetical protein
MEREDYSARLKFEHELINRRVTWLLTSQSILFAAYGVALKAPAPWFLRTVAVTGGAISVFIFVGILAAFAAKYCTWRDFKNSGNPTEPFWVRTSITYIAFIPEFAMPIVFTIAWATLFCKAGSVGQ